MSKKIWSKNDKEANENVWDDTELIKMYEESISSTYKTPKTKVTSKDYESSDGKCYTWKVGAKCMAPFQEDEEAEVEWFPATIDSIGGKDDLEVDVTFDVYGNQETVHMKDIWLKTETDEEEDKNQDVEMKSPKVEKAPSSRRRNGSKPSTSVESSSRNYFSPSIPVIAPPPPPGVLGMVPPSEVEALSSMLMSWYMSGYHTGYYKALSDQKKSDK